MPGQHCLRHGPRNITTICCTKYVLEKIANNEPGTAWFCDAIEMISNLKKIKRSMERP